MRPTPRRLPRALVLLGLLGLSSACVDGFAGRQTLLANAKDISFCCDENATFPVEVGEFQVQIFAGQFDDLEPSTVAAVFTSSIDTEGTASAGGHTVPNAVTLSVASGAPLQLRSNTIKVSIENCRFAAANVRFVVDVSGRRISDNTLRVETLTGSFRIINTCPPTGEQPTPPQILIETITGQTFAVAAFNALGRDAPTGVPTRNPSAAIQPQIPPLPHTEVFQTGAVVVDLDQNQLDAAFTGATPAFPLGVGPNGLTVQSDFNTPLTPGRYFITWQCMEGDVPINVRDLYHTFGHFSDRDGNPANNFRTGPGSENDPTNDTDTWFQLSHDPFLRWNFTTWDTQSGFPDPLFTGTRAIISGQIQVFVIPVADLLGATELLARYYTFTHEGDLGQGGGQWSADTTPPVDEAPLTQSLDLSF